jgi:hypothetical protein
MSEEVKNKSFEHIEIITTPNTKLFEVRLIVSMDTYGDDDETGSALEWLHNLLHLASEGEDIKTGASAFMMSMLSVGETQVHMCKIEQVQG